MQVNHKAGQVTARLTKTKQRQLQTAAEILRELGFYSPAALETAVQVQEYVKEVHTFSTEARNASSQSQGTDRDTDR